MLQIKSIFVLQLHTVGNSFSTEFDLKQHELRITRKVTSTRGSMCETDLGPVTAKEKDKSDHHTGSFLCDFAFSHSKQKINNKFEATHSWILSAWPLLQFLLCAFPGGEKKRQ